MEKLQLWQSLAQNPGILDPFSFPRPVQGTKAGSIIRPIRFLRLGNAKGLKSGGKAFLPGVEGGAKGSEPRPIPVAPGNPGL